MPDTNAHLKRKSSIKKASSKKPQVNAKDVLGTKASISRAGISRKTAAYTTATPRGFTTRYVDEEAFDDAFPDGVYVIPSESESQYNLRAMMDYCKKRGIDPSELTPKQMKQFEVI